MSGVSLPALPKQGLHWRLPDGVRISPTMLVSLLVTLASYQLAVRIGALGLWSDSTTELAGRAALSAAGKSDPTTLLASYPPLPYVLLLLGDLLGRPLGLDPVALIDALLLGGLTARYGRSLSNGGARPRTVIALLLLLALHPLAITAVAHGPQALLLVWGCWILGRGMMDTRTITGINDTIALTLALPMLAMTSAQGAAIAIGSLPFLILAVPRDLSERHYFGTYVVLLFPLVFSVLCLFALSAILLHTPLSVVIWDAYHVVQTDARHRWIAVALAPVTTAGVAVIAVMLACARAAPRALRESAAAALASLMLASALVTASGIADHAGEVLQPALGLALAVSTRWPVARMAQAGRGLLVGALISGLVWFGANLQAEGPIMRVVTGHRGAMSADQALGRYLAGRQDVMIDALAHPAVVAERGGAEGLLTDRSPVFGVSVIAHRVLAPMVAVRAHRPGESDDAISRSLPRLFADGAPGYRLTFDQGGWRVWARRDRSEIP